ncbi:hypothetical protein BF32_104 [Bacillus thuringiensis]|nr:hypothetical protein BF32_104 [Bacillus thuringiensis]
MEKQGLVLEPQGIEPLFIDAFFLRIWENRRIFFTDVLVWYLNWSWCSYYIVRQQKR